MQKVSIQFSKFLIIGAANTVLSYLLFLLFYWFEFHYSVALALVSLVTIPNAYLWQRYWIFKSKNKVIKEFTKFVLVYGASFLLNLGGLSFLVEFSSMDPRVAEIFALSFAALMTFIAQKYWSFSD